MIAAIRRWCRQFAEGFRHGYRAPERTWAERVQRRYLIELCKGRPPLCAFAIALGRDLWRSTRR